MSGTQGDRSAGASVSAVTTAQLKKVAGDGIWGAGASVSAEAANLGEALVATLRGTATQSLLTPELQQLADSVLRVATVGFPWIEAEDGIKLAAHTIKLNTGEPRPLVILPAGWTPVGWPLFEYAHLCLALKGYHVLAYTPRGIGLTVRLPGGGFADGPFTSGGTIDVGGPKDWADGTSVIDYAVRHFAPSRIGFLGESYGSGIGQLVAAHDERVDAVAALSTWGNLATSLYHHDTRHLAAVEVLLSLTGGPVERKFDEETQEILADFTANRNMERVVAWGTERAPETYVGTTNARGVPTFISNTWHEGLFPVNQVLDTFNRLTVPKRLNLWIGDHAVPEGPGLTGPLTGPTGPNLAMSEAYAWLDHHLRGAANDVPTWPEVSNQVMFTYRTTTDPGSGRNTIVTPAVREPRQTWDEVTTSTEQWYLASTATGDQDGLLGTHPAPGWSREFSAGGLTGATAMDGIVQTGKDEWNGNPKVYATDEFDRKQLAVWTTGPLSTGADGQAARRIRGVPRVRLTVRSSAASTTLVAYLFDIAADNTARIVTHEPYTLSDLVPDQDTTVTWDLQAAAYDVPADHRLALVVNSRDKLYSHATAEGTSSTTTISSPPGEESCLHLPLG
ncbi:CocE/NonD family hydrolase C-terminal non-catalytic domain-containing protein [Streptomyces sp. NPDC002138]|uniref:CocE/NonD family hydrolase C-terminal non-catalytic domain-containing protein n=1 Tax=Streptomyces sp. NPDC002138 TaxID=3154410 RepID=UPI00332645C9